MHQIVSSAEMQQTYCRHPQATGLEAQDHAIEACEQSATATTLVTSACRPARSLPDSAAEGEVNRVLAATCEAVPKAALEHWRATNLSSLCLQVKSIAKAGSLSQPLACWDATKLEQRQVAVPLATLCRLWQQGQQNDGRHRWPPASWQRHTNPSNRTLQLKLQPASDNSQDAAATFHSKRQSIAANCAPS